MADFEQQLMDSLNDPVRVRAHGPGRWAHRSPDRAARPRGQEALRLLLQAKIGQLAPEPAPEPAPRGVPVGDDDIAALSDAPGAPFMVGMMASVVVGNAYQRTRMQEAMARADQYEAAAAAAATEAATAAAAPDELASGTIVVSAPSPTPSRTAEPARGLWQLQLQLL
jgi:hypothetical protein